MGTFWEIFCYQTDYSALTWQKVPTDINTNFGNNGQKQWRAAICLYKILNFEGV